MFGKILNFFKKDTEELAEQWYDEKSRLMEEILGREHDMVQHAIIPYEIGGALDLYYYPNDIPGVGIASKELSTLPKKGSTNKVFKVYELVMFTRLPLDMEAGEDTDFGKMHANINSVLNVIAPYSANARLNPRETCEFPEDMEKVGGKCFIFDGYKSDGTKAAFGMLAVIEVFRTEMDYARENGSEQLIQKLKDAGHYPYSDLDREPVV